MGDEAPILMCLHCGEKPARVKFCSRECGKAQFYADYLAEHGHNYGQRGWVKCAGCKKPTLRRKFCSRTCSGKSSDQAAARRYYAEHGECYSTMWRRRDKERREAA